MPVIFLISKSFWSGSSGSTSTPGRTTQAEMLQKAALLLDVDGEAIIMQNEPENTYKEAEVYAENYRYTHPVILVTSAAHMPRAVKVFRHFGTDLIPSPTNYRLKGSWKRKWFGFPSMNNLKNMKVGIYEYAGIFWYRIRG